jgi:hypothetical protein
VTTKPEIEGIALGTCEVGIKLGVKDGERVGSEVTKLYCVFTFHSSAYSTVNKSKELLMSAVFVASIVKTTSAETPKVGVIAIVSTDSTDEESNDTMASDVSLDCNAFDNNTAASAVSDEIR